MLDNGFFDGLSIPDLIALHQQLFELLEIDADISVEQGQMPIEAVFEPRSKKTLKLSIDDLQIIPQCWRPFPLHDAINSRMDTSRREHIIVSHQKGTPVLRLKVHSSCFNLAFSASMILYFSWPVRRGSVSVPGIR